MMIGSFPVLVICNDLVSDLLVIKKYFLLYFALSKSSYSIILVQLQSIITNYLFILNLNMGQEESTTSALEHFKHRFIILPHPLYNGNQSIKLLHEKLNNKKFVLTIVTNNDQIQRSKLEELLCRKLATPSTNITPLNHYIFEEKNSYCAKISKCYLLISMEQSQTLRHFVLEKKCKNIMKPPLNAQDLMLCIEQVASAINWLKYQNQVHGNITMDSIFVKQTNNQNSQQYLKFYLGDPWICPLIGTTQYPSLEKLMKMNNQFEDEDPYLSDLFSLGMVILQYLFEGLKGIYKSNYKIDMKKLKDYTSSVEDIKLRQILTILVLGSQEDKKDFLIKLSHKKQKKDENKDKSIKIAQKQPTPVKTQINSRPNATNYDFFHRYASMNQRPSPIQKTQQYPTRYNSNNYEKTPPYQVENLPQRSEQPRFHRVQSQIFSVVQPQDKFTKQPTIPPPYHNYTNNKSISPLKKRENSTETRPIITIGGTKNMSLDHRKTIPNNMEQNKFSKKPSYEIINLANTNTQPIQKQYDVKFGQQFFQPYDPLNKQIRPFQSNLLVKESNVKPTFNFTTLKAQIHKNNFQPITLPISNPNQFNFAKDLTKPVYNFDTYQLKESEKIKSQIYYQAPKPYKSPTEYQINLQQNHKYINQSIKNLQNRIKNLRDETTKSMTSNYDGVVLTSTNFLQQNKITNQPIKSSQIQTQTNKINYQKQQTISIPQQQEEQKTTHQDQKSIYMQSYSVKIPQPTTKQQVQTNSPQRQIQRKSEIINDSPLQYNPNKGDDEQIDSPPARQTQIQQLNTLMIPQQSDEDSQPSKSKIQRQFIQQIYQNGGHYRGYVRNGKRDGQGTFYYKDGGYYQGNWKKNMMNGYGKLYYETGKLAYEGYWHEDQFHGRGKVYNDSPIPLKESFDYTDFENIELYWQLYDGDLVHDIKQGYGKIILSNGEVFEGQFKDDKVHGRGIFKKLDGKVIKGLWKKCKLVNEL